MPGASLRAPEQRTKANCESTGFSPQRGEGYQKRAGAFHMHRCDVGKLTAWARVLLRVYWCNKEKLNTRALSQSIKLDTSIVLRTPQFAETWFITPTSWKCAVEAFVYSIFKKIFFTVEGCMAISVDYTKTFQHKEWKETTVDCFLQPAMTVMNFVAGWNK